MATPLAQRMEMGCPAPLADRVPRLTVGTRVESRRLPDGSARHRLFNPLHATFAMVNEDGLAVVRAVDGTRTVEGVAAAAARAVPGPALVERTGAFLDRLVRQKLLYWEDEGPPAALETTALDRLEEVWLNLTNRCNLRCATCFKDAGGAYRDELTTGEMLELIGQLPPLVTRYVILSGGEPLLRRDLPVLLEALARNGLGIFLITNGTLLDDRWADRLAGLPDLVVQVSLDGSSPEVNDPIRGPGSFERAIAAARRLRDRGVDVRIYPTVTRRNIHDLPNLERLYFELRPDRPHFAFAKFHPTGRGARHMEELYIPPEEFLERITTMGLRGAPRPAGEEGHRGRDLSAFAPERVLFGVRKVNCGLGSGTLSIDADGTVYPCHWLHDPRFAAGNVRTEPLARIYYNSRVLADCRDLRVDGRITACTACDLRYICGGGCRARALAFTGDIAGLDPECPVMRPALERGLWCLPMWEVEGRRAGEAAS